MRTDDELRDLQHREYRRLVLETDRDYEAAAKGSRRAVYDLGAADAAERVRVLECENAALRNELDGDEARPIGLRGAHELLRDECDTVLTENAALRERLRDVLWLVEARPGEVLAPRIRDICRAALATDKEET